MLEADFNCPKSSGMGRLFDGAAALLGIKTKCSYEGQGAVLLEAAAGISEGVYPVEFYGDMLRFDWRPMIRAMYYEKKQGTDVSLISAKFLNTITEMGAKLCIQAGKVYGIRSIILSGGSFQNMYIMSRLPHILEKEGFKVYTHRRVSTNDEGIALGQLMAAQAVLEKRIEK